MVLIMIFAISIFRHLVSCGHDGEVRIWKGIDDDDPNTITTGDKAYSAAIKVG